MLSFDFDPTLPLRLPGGTLEEGEEPFEGVQREVREEMGLQTLSLIRKLGVQHYYKEYIQADVERHDYLIQAPDDMPDGFSVVVQGEGGDAGEIFHYRWLDATKLEQMDEEFRRDITPDYIPELFAKPDSAG